jgi:transcriptional regulator with XRE-family HTH domain
LRRRSSSRDALAPTPLHRLIFLHHRTARDAAETLGLNEHTVSRWLTGKGKPGYDAMMKLADVYRIGPHLLSAHRERSPDTWAEFVRQLGDPERIETVETETIPAARRERIKAVEKTA